MFKIISNDEDENFLEIFDEKFDHKVATEIIIKFNNQLNEFILYHFEQIFTSSNSNSVHNANGIPNEENLLEFVKYICEIFEKIFQKENVRNFKKLSDLIYMNFYKTITDLNLFDYIFYKFWDSYFSLSDNYKFSKDKLEIFKKFSSEKLHNLFNKYFEFLDEENKIRIFTNFNENFLPNYLDSLKIPNSNQINEFIQPIYILSNHFEKIKFIFDINFRNFNLLDKDKILLQNIYKKLKLKESNSLTHNINNPNDIIKKLLESNDYLSIIKMSRLLVYDKEILKIFLQILLISLKNHLETIYLNCLKEKNYSKNLIFFKELKLIEENLIKTIKNKNLPSSNSFQEEFKLSINEIFSIQSRKEKVIFFSESFDILLRNKNIDLLEIILNYFNFGYGIHDSIRFEDDYIKKMIERSIDEVFDKLSELDVVAKITTSNKETFTYSYKLQTAINNIKINKKSFVNLIGIPAHCYSTVSLNGLGCKPVIRDNFILSLFDDVKSSASSGLGNSLNFPANSKLIFQQGWIEFNFFSDRSTVYKANLLQFLILKFIYNHKVSCRLEDLIEYFEVNEELCLFLLGNLIDNMLIERNQNNYKSYHKDRGIISESNHGNSVTLENEKNVLLVVDVYEELTRFKNLNFKNNNNCDFSLKQLNTLVDCHILKYLKRVKDSNVINIVEEMKKLSQLNIYTSPNNKDQNAKDLMLDEDKILQRLNHLSEQSYIRKVDNKQFSYN